MMSSNQRHDRICEVFLAACDLDPAARTGFVAAECDGDADLQREVEEMLAADSGDAMLDRPLSDSLVAELDCDAGKPDLLPEQIGPYEILDRLGEGGMGCVYRARQTHPAREVALKVIKPGMIASGTVRRFRHEAELLARLAHPGIAQVFATGEAETGSGTQPFLAMELVGGERLDRWAAAQQLTTDQRIELIAQVADAVHHAHLRGVMHRDLKPSNILVDAGGSPKVLDFGVARLADADGQTLLTMPGQIVGTLGYMSPEQVEGDADIRADIYSLGAIAYELLSGKPPIELKGLGLAEAARRIVDTEPTRIGTLHRALRGDLETILHKALEKDRERRYESAAAFAADLRRFLQHEAVSARAPSAIYQLRKLARRHRAIFAGCMIAIAALTIGLVAAWMQTDRANQRLAESNGVIEYLESILTSANPDVDGPNVKLRDALARAGDEIDTFLDKYPRAEARLQLTMGEAWFSLVDYDRAITHLTRAIELLDVDDDRQVRALTAVCNTRSMRDEPELLQQSGRDLVALATRLRGPQSLAVVTGNVAIIKAMVMRSEYDAAEPILGAAMADAVRNQHDKTTPYLQLLGTLAGMQKMMGDMPTSLATQERVVALYTEINGAKFSSTLHQRLNLASYYVQAGKVTAADEEITAVITLLLERYPSDHTLVVEAEQVLANVRSRQGKFEEARVLLSKVIDVFTKAIGARCKKVMAARVDLAKVRMRLRDPKGAEEILRDLYDYHRAEHGPGHLETCYIALPLSAALRNLRRTEEAEEVLRETREAATEVPFDNPFLIQMECGQAMCLRQMGQPAEARDLLLAALQRAPRAFGEDHPQINLFERDLALCHVQLGEVAEGERVLARAAAALLRTQGKESAYTKAVQRLLEQVRAGPRE